jgi:AAA+ superfamily predicted ATPase
LDIFHFLRTLYGTDGLLFLIYWLFLITFIYILGTGKTLLANAVASEANVPIFSFKGSELDEVEKIRDLFEVFHDTNDDTGSCVIFIDNIDTLGCKFKFDSTMKL